MQLTVRILSSFADADTKQTEDQERELFLDVPDHLLERFKLALGHFAQKEMRASSVLELTVTIPYRMSWDPVFKVQRWFGGWLQEADLA